VIHWRACSTVAGLITAVCSVMLLGGCNPVPAESPSNKVGPARIGVIHLSPQLEAPVVVGLRQGFVELGQEEGRDYILDIRTGAGRYETALEAVRELAAAQVQVIVSAGTVATRAAKDGAGDVPIVFTQVGEPVSSGFVESLAQPGGNMTGFAHLLPATTSKRLELLRELAPSASRIMIVFDPTNPSSAASAAVANETTGRLGVLLQERYVRTAEDVPAVLSGVRRSNTDAILVLPDSLVVNQGALIIETAARERIPAIFHESTWVEQGGLASYGASFTDLARQAAAYVDRVIKGARPATLPVQQPTRFDLVFNLKTAATLGLSIPESLLADATETIS
jgi:putative tryptophan/tyrosine transport system substrate-binding protein